MLGIKPVTEPVKHNWIPWTEKSAGIPFKTTKKGLGDGEERVAAELNTTVMGQNCCYDMEPVLNGIKTKCDVKKLDSQDDFNTGKEGRDALRATKTEHIKLFGCLNDLYGNKIFTDKENQALSELQELSPDELCVGNLKRLDQACKMLHEKKQQLRSGLPAVKITINGCIRERPLDMYYNTCKMYDIPFPKEHESFVNVIQLLQKMDHPYIDNPGKFTGDLEALVGTIFHEIKVIIVDEKKGYMVLEREQIKFYRITRGNPRFQVLFYNPNQQNIF